MKTFERKKHHFPSIKVTGGPHAKDMAIDIDGEPLKGITRTEIVLDVNDAVRVTLFRVAEVYMDAEGLTEELHKVKVYSTEAQRIEAADEDGRYAVKRELIASGTGATLAEALRAAAVEADGLG